MFERTARQSVIDISKTFPVLLITGPRQVGKSTLLSLCDKDRSYVTLDDLNERQLAITDPALFLQTHKPPLIIDEIQYAPELFPYIKMAVDKSKKKGEFWLTGSQKFQLMKGINESLAGRIAIIDLLGFSEKERDRMATKQKPFIPTAEWIQNSSEFSKSFDVEELYKRIWLGSFPALISTPDTPRDVFYNSYIQTYIERDVKDILNISNSISFYNFIRATAARTGQLLNYADLARDIDIDTKTAKAWLSVLETSGLVKLLPPYHNNLTKRIIKTPKLYFLDTGLATFLTGWDSPASLSAGAMSGAILETHVFIEILKSYWHNCKIPNIYFYRDADQKEIDFLIEQNMKLYPIEVKRSATPDIRMTKSFDVLEKFGNVGEGVILCLRQGHIPLAKDITVVNIGYL